MSRSIDTQPTVPGELAQTIASSPGETVIDATTARADLPVRLPPEQRYSDRALLAEGGMGAIETCSDRVIGRQVVMKRIRDEVGGAESMRARFLREARVQGRLEHPAIVPVYDLGRDESGNDYFTMKRVRGDTLADIIDRLAAGHRETEKKYTRRRLLTALASVCLAMDFAHARGVIHRDLKPANIMLGDFGEVYVLDWGIARLSADADSDVLGDPVTDETTARKTAAGALLGTPGYMSPEQCRGDWNHVGASSDVYALGAILFELLALEPLIPGTGVISLVKASLAGANARTSERVPDRDVAPELEAICVRATALDASDRFPSARAMHDALESYLDGERNLDLRRDMARDHIRRAVETLGADPKRASASMRADALREAGRALALDPSNLQALQTIYRLIDEPPAEVPSEVREAMAEGEAAQRRITGQIASAGYASLVLYLPMLLWLGIRSASAAVVFYGLAALAVAATAIVGFGKRPHQAGFYAALVVSNAAFAATATIFGPLFVTPMLVAVNTAGFALHLDGARRFLAVGIGCVAIAVPMALQWLGVLAPSYAFEHGQLVVHPGMVTFPETPTLLFLLVTSLAGVLTGSVLMGRVRDALVAAELKLQLQRWQLRHLVP